MITAAPDGTLSMPVAAHQLGSGAPVERPVELRYRRRYVDLMTNERTRRIFDIRRRTVRAIRHHLEDAGFWEVEGPILSLIQGGATARPKARAGPWPCASHQASATIRPQGLPPVMHSPRP